MPDFTDLTALFAAANELCPPSAELRQAQSECEDEISDAMKEAIAADVDAKRSHKTRHQVARSTVANLMIGYTSRRTTDVAIRRW